MCLRFNPLDTFSHDLVVVRNAISIWIIIIVLGSGAMTSEAQGGKWPISSIQPRPLLEGALLGRHLCPKQVANGWDHLIHARGRGRERPKALLVRKREKDSWQNLMDKNLSWDGQWKRENTEHAQVQWRLNGQQGSGQL